MGCWRCKFGESCDVVSSFSKVWCALIAGRLKSAGKRECFFRSITRHHFNFVASSGCSHGVLLRSAWAAPEIMGEPNKILLTGASGYVGAAIIRAFVKHGKIDKLTAVVRDEVRAQEVKEFGAVNVKIWPNSG